MKNHNPFHSVLIGKFLLLLNILKARNRGWHAVKILYMNVQYENKFLNY